MDGTAKGWRSSRLKVSAAGLAAVIFFGGIALFANHINVGAEGRRRSGCEEVAQDDDLLHLAARTTHPEALAQLRRWATCDDALGRADGRRTTARALAAVGPLWAPDHLIILAVSVLLLVSALVMRRQRRWRLASAAGVALAVGYAGADLVEDWSLHRFLARDDWSTLLPISSAVKFGAFFAAMPLIFGATFVLLFGEPEEDVAPRPGPTALAEDTDPAPTGFRRRWARRLATPDERPPVVAPQDRSRHTVAGPPRTGPLGVCCSGGGIRSAAFSLGALQALDEQPEGTGGGRASELADADAIYSVSGGSYMAAAWVTARPSPENVPEPKPWSRQSPEEQHLRRNASYLAPGLAGKVRALLWFLLAFAANAGLVVLTIGALCLPLGWALHLGVGSRPVQSGELTLPAGGCIELDNGSFLAAVAGTKLKLVTGSKVFAADGVVVEAPPGPAVVAPDAPAAPLPDGCRFPPTAPAGLTGLRPTAPGRLFQKGTGVPVVPGRTLTVHGRAVAACPSVQTPRETCPARAADVYAFGGSSRIVGAPEAVLALDAPALVSRTGRPQLVAACDGAPCERFRLATWLSWVPRGLVGLLALTGVTLVTMRPDPEARRKMQRRTTRLALVTGGVVLLLWWIPQLILLLTSGRSWLATRAGVATGTSTGTLTILLALLTQLRAASGKSETPTGRLAEFAKAVGGRLRPILIRFTAILVGPALLLVVALAFAAHGASIQRDYTQITLGVVLAGWLAILGSCGDLNRWSLHVYYRDRLSSAFAFDPRSGQCRPDQLADLPVRPHLVLCATANLADTRITPPGRPAVAWNFSKDSIGSPAITHAVGAGTYRPDAIPPRFSELRSVWTSVAVSGAAISPAMGKMSRPERFLFALGNLRLGVWYPNPRYLCATDPSQADFTRSWYETHHPRPWYFFKEALGLHRLHDPWVYVTDGGHYENLGLVQLLSQRRPTEVYCFDAAGDTTSTFGTLADAMRLAREEHGIEITLDPRAMKADKDGISPLGIWAGTVAYPADARGQVTTGWLVVAKLTVPKSAPFDIVDLARTLPSFPTNPTADQLYTDQKFEAYRALGNHLGHEALGAGRRIRALMTDDRRSPANAVAAVNDELCAAAPTAETDKDAADTR